MGGCETALDVRRRGVLFLGLEWWFGICHIISAVGPKSASRLLCLRPPIVLKTGAVSIAPVFFE